MRGSKVESEETEEKSYMLMRKEGGETYSISILNQNF